MQSETGIYVVRTTINQESSVADLITTAVIGETDVWEDPYTGEHFPTEKAVLEYMIVPLVHRIVLGAIQALLLEYKLENQCRIGLVSSIQIDLVSNL